MRVVVTATALEQLKELDDWWRVNRARVPDRVLEEFERIEEVLLGHPSAGRKYSADPSYRLLAMKGTPYQVFYSVDDEQETLTIEAVWSAMRGKGPPLG